MSGPKTYAVTVSDQQRLESERRRREKEESDELHKLEEKIRRKEKLEASDLKRQEHLRRKEQQRHEREEERQRLAAERAAALCQQELAAYHVALAQFNKALASRTDLLARFSGLVLPNAPLFDEPDPVSIDSIRAAHAQVTAMAQAYQQQVDTALMQYHQSASGERATDKMQAWMNQFGSRATRTTSDVLRALESDAIFVGDAQRKLMLATITQSARELVADLSQEPALDLSQTVLDALDKVFASDSESSALVALAELRGHIDQQSEDRRQAEAARQAEQELIAKRAKREQTRMVAAEAADILESMGYSVSGIGDTAFIRKGHIYGVHQDHPDHAVRFEFSADGAVRSVPLRIDDAPHSVVLSAADNAFRAQQDKQFDTVLCSHNPASVATLRKHAAARGIDLKFKVENAPGTLAVQTVRSDELGEVIAQARLAKHTVPTLKTRSL